MNKELDKRMVAVRVTMRRLETQLDALAESVAKAKATKTIIFDIEEVNVYPHNGEYHDHHDIWLSPPEEM